MRYPITPDGRYFVVRGRLWRCTNPQLPAADRQRHVHDLMAARSLIKRSQDDPEQLKQARKKVHSAKLALGERGPPWWGEDGPVLDRHLVKNTPYADWYAALNLR